MRRLGVVYPAFMLFTIVATGNHFVFDAVAGAIVMVAGLMVAKRLANPTPSGQAAVAVAAAPC